MASLIHEKNSRNSSNYIVKSSKALICSCFSKSSSWKYFNCPRRRLQKIFGPPYIVHIFLMFCEKGKKNDVKIVTNWEFMLKIAQKLIWGETWPNLFLWHLDLNHVMWPTPPLPAFVSSSQRGKNLYEVAIEPFINQIFNTP